MQVSELSRSRSLDNRWVKRAFPKDLEGPGGRYQPSGYWYTAREGDVHSVEHTCGLHRIISSEARELPVHEVY